MKAQTDQFTNRNMSVVTMSKLDFTDHYTWYNDASDLEAVRGEVTVSKLV